MSASNTWEYKTITFAGDTSGVIDNDNSEELSVIFWLVAGTTFKSGTLNTSWGSMTNANRAVGQVNIGDNTVNDWLITGVQLEAGTSATDFEFLPYDVSLARCQRYYEKTYSIGTAPATNTNDGLHREAGSTDSGSNFVFSESFCVKKRATPTITIYTGSGTSGSWSVECDGINTTKTLNAFSTNDRRIGIYFTFGSAKNWVSALVAGHWVADAEL